MLEKYLENYLKRKSERLFKKGQKMASPELVHGVFFRVVRPKLQFKQHFNSFYHRFF
jgi:hypothetical protein